MKMKIMTSLLISTVMVLCLAGCGSQNTTSTVQTAGGSAETQSASVPEQPDTAEALPDASTEVSTETLTDSMTEVSTKTLSDHSTEEVSEPSQTENETDIADSESESGKTLVVYYSATNVIKLSGQRTMYLDAIVQNIILQVPDRVSPEVPIKDSQGQQEF